MYANVDNFTQGFAVLCQAMKQAHSMRRSTWQGLDMGSRPEARTAELINVTLRTHLRGEESIDHWRKDVEPYLPWADDHFTERTCGRPLNPGNTWDKWRHGKSADRFRGVTGKFNHTYMERLWPKYADKAVDDSLTPVAHKGIRWTYGDLMDVVNLLDRTPDTRQAYIPLFFPEDTGVADGGRKPCTLGYQFILSDNQLHLYYPMRSCDLANHFLDDCYLAVRLVIWMLDRLRERSSAWDHVTPGEYVMHMTNLHAFVNDLRNL